ncbi:hypothetical protein QUG28_17005 [Bacillus hominis]|uniref:hypothetical protein n=1 Tax=Bacillus hominis TaxID=2817478 RepID=UPI0025A0D34B|nr:hypothetical protein [Bacillus hominis]MDM5434395.1 hypothetical protein [Bacillus hominis]
MITFFIKKKRRREWYSFAEYKEYEKSGIYTIVAFLRFFMDLTFALGLPFLLIDFSATIGPMLKIGVITVILELVHKSIHADYVYFEKDTGRRDYEIIPAKKINLDKKRDK